MKKRILSGLLVLCVLIGLLPHVTSNAFDFVSSGICGDQLIWTFDDATNHLSISGTGPMTRWYSYLEVPWNIHVDCIETVEIGPGVTNVGELAFVNCSALVSVVLSDTVTSIGYLAFGNCTNLVSINIPDGVTSIGKEAFKCCYALESIHIPDSVTIIEEEAFSACEGMTSASIGNGVTSIGTFAFQNCFELTSLTLGNQLTTINYAAFVRCYSLSSLVLPDSVKFIGEGAFAECTNLDSITIGDHVNSLHATAFRDTAYYNDLANWKNGVLYLGKYLIKVRDNISGSYFVEPGVITIAGGAFVNCYDLTSLIIADGVSIIDTYAFWGCRGLKTVYIPTSVTAIKMGAFVECGALTDIYYAGSKEMWDEILIDENYNMEMCRARKHFSVEAPEAPEYTPNTPFVDVKAGDYFALPVEWALENKITNGTTPATFSPESGCTRGQIVTFLWRAEGCPEPQSTESPFTDITATDYYYKAVLWAVEQKITTGTGHGKFSPNNPCTRGQVATFLWRAKGEPTPTITVNPFEDISASEYYYNAVLWAVEQEITNGTGKALFSPAKECTRGQIVTFLYRAATME